VPKPGGGDSVISLHSLDLLPVSKNEAPKATSFPLPRRD